MNICCFSRVNYWQGIKGGMDLHGKMLSEGLVHHGHQVSMISTYRPGNSPFLDKNGVRYYHLKNTVFGSRRHGWPQKSIRKYLNLHGEKPFDLLWSQSFDAYGITATHPKSAYPPVVLRLAGSVVQEYRSFRSNFFLHLKKPNSLARAALGLLFSYFVTQRPLMEYADGIIVVSTVVVDDIQRWFGEHFAAKCVVVNNGIDIDNFKPDPMIRRQIRQQYGIKENENLLLSLGRITHEKGHHLAIEAIREIERRGFDVKLMIAGKGPFLEGLKQNVITLGLEKKVIFIGHIENACTVKYYNAADIFLMPTLTIEGLPFTLLEAMACTKPVIASRLGGNLTLIDDRANGLFIIPGDVNDIADKVEMLLTNHDLTTKLSSAARDTIINGYSIDKMISNYFEIMETIAQNR